jgi:hypothetical protein
MEDYAAQIGAQVQEHLDAVKSQVTPKLLEEIFQYHPADDYRKKLHDACNGAVLRFAIEALPDPLTGVALISPERLAAECSDVFARLLKPCLALNRAELSLRSAVYYAEMGNLPVMIMDLQIARMLVNQAIVYESLGISL